MDWNSSRSYTYYPFTILSWSSRSKMMMIISSNRNLDIIIIEYLPWGEESTKVNRAQVPINKTSEFMASQWVTGDRYWCKSNLKERGMCILKRGGGLPNLCHIGSALASKSYGAPYLLRTARTYRVNKSKFHDYIF